MRRGKQYRLEIRVCDLAAPFVFECCVVTVCIIIVQTKFLLLLSFGSPSSTLDSFIDLFESFTDDLAQSKNSFLVCDDFNVNTLKEDRTGALLMW